MIVDSKEMRESLYSEYEKIHSILKRQSFTELRDYMKERTEELSRSFYFNTQEMEDLSGLSSNATNDEMEFISLDPDVEVEIMGEGKLIKITTWNGKAQILYAYKDKSMYECFHMIFRRSGNKWVLTR